jgi:hypothetical protein
MVRWTAFADLTFAESAHMAFARALEQAETEAHQLHADAWMIEDRRICFSFAAETSVPVLEGTRRLLAALVLEASSGDVLVETVQPYDRWARKAATPSISKEITIGEDQERAGETIRTEAS